MLQRKYKKQKRFRYQNNNYFHFQKYGITQILFKKGQSLFKTMV
jgi:hypothetical protein